MPSWGSDAIWGGGDAHNPPRDWSFTLTKSTCLVHGWDIHFLLDHQVEILRGNMVFNRSMFYLKQFIIIKKKLFFFTTAENDPSFYWITVKLNIGSLGILRYIQEDIPMPSVPWSTYLKLISCDLKLLHWTMQRRKKNYWVLVFPLSLHYLNSRVLKKIL